MAERGTNLRGGDITFSSALVNRIALKCKHPGVQNANKAFGLRNPHPVLVSLRTIKGTRALACRNWLLELLVRQTGDERPERSAIIAERPGSAYDSPGVRVGHAAILLGSKLIVGQTERLATGTDHEPGQKKETAEGLKVNPRK